MLPSKLCWESIFWWTNETVSFGFLLILLMDLIYIYTPSDQYLVSHIWSVPVHRPINQRYCFPENTRTFCG